MTAIQSYNPQPGFTKAPVASKPSPEAWLDFGKDVCEFIGDAAVGGVAAALCGPMVGASALVGGLRNLPKAASQLWREGQTPTDSVPDYLISRGAAAVTMIPLALTPVIYGLAGLAVGALGCALEAKEKGLEHGIQTGYELSRGMSKGIEGIEFHL
ncbi:MAG: hypothetical protein U0931_29960 [Vulcanimicrobiota bacterium]